MNLPWLLAALLIAGLILTCAIKHGTEYANWFAQTQENQQIQTAVDILRDYPTAAGGKK